MSLNYITDNHHHEEASMLPQTGFLLENSISQVNDAADHAGAAGEKRPERKRQRNISVSKSYYFI
jgi:hypothetical protein